MLDHVGFAVEDAERARAFYTAALAPLGITQLMEVGADQTESGGKAYGFGKDQMPFFWFGDKETVGAAHLAFTAQTRAEVDRFYRAALDAGGIDNGAPGLRPHYHADYYGAFVIDPDGHNIEAVCHRRE